MVPNPSGWAVKKAGSDRATVIKETKKEAVDSARDMARNQKTELIVHKKNGQIGEKDSYGGDTIPPKDANN